jgi:uncharacterized protein (DUF169 family)
MPTCSQYALGLRELLGTGPAVAISFVDAAPPGLPRRAALPASCAYWRAAAEGESFYTEAADHEGCPIGAHTHGAPLSTAKAEELQGLVEMMVQLRYLKREEVPQIPHRKSALRVAVYAPLEKAAAAPDVVLVRGTARQLMLLAEAAQMAGVAGSSPAIGRPTCAALPLALESGKTATSFGCVGNRVYTGLPDDEAYVAIPGDKLEALMIELPAVVRANAELEKFHRARNGS